MVVLLGTGQGQVVRKAVDNRGGLKTSFYVHTLSTIVAPDKPLYPRAFAELRR